ncbi:MAG: hypothetical protein ABIH78_01440, partial [Candidatus Peregrinibacteria bacterium]
MRKVHRQLQSFFAVVFSFLIFCLSPLSAYAIAVPQYLGYEGYLMTSVYNAVTGYYGMVFEIYDSLSGGTLLWTESHANVYVVDGYFSVQLGRTTALSLTFDAPYWISVTVEGETLTPRQPINSVGYSYRSDGSYSLYLDDDVDTNITSSADDQIDVAINGADDFSFVANIFQALSGSSIQTDTISETTADAGVTIDGVKLKDGGATVLTGGTNTFN